MIKGLWIPIEILSDETLSQIDKMLYVSAKSLSDNGYGCEATSEYFAALFGASVSTIKRSIARLLIADMIEIDHFRRDGKKRRTIKPKVILTLDNDDKGHNDPSTGVILTLEQGSDRPLINKELINNKNNKEMSRFSKPTKEEVFNYSREIDYELDPDAFIDFYDSKGWKIGSSPMKNWKAAIRNWKKRNKKDKPEMKINWQGVRTI